MKSKAGRSAMDRVRHTIFFEMGMLISALPIGMFFIEAKPHAIGGTIIVLSLIAMLWNAIFNYLFDHWMVCKFGSAKKAGGQRIVHSILFEIGLIILTIPILSWTLDMSLLEALYTDIAFVIFALFYSYFYNMVYDHVFPFENSTLEC
ncbi:PACE efflux transporter [Vibrio sp. 10N.261.51.F12]|uniref:PACE efflux transporter n=1 Tax=Vibrio sp. 10N.261.51.F12 TaxID=3229679 RepID=UPI00354FBEF6